MTFSDVAVVGMVGTECFAFDYYLKGRASCNSSQVKILIRLPYHITFLYN